jgi:hypothetical protein
VQATRLHPRRRHPSNSHRVYVAFWCFLLAP